SIAAPLIRDNVDTDAIIPSREMKSVSKTGLSDGLFAGWRYTDVDARVPDPDFVLNKPEYQGAAILLGGANFGCGSSREHAVWALAQYGFRAVIAPSFADIFTSNCYRNAVLPVRLSSTDVDGLIRSTQGGLLEIVIDLTQQVVRDDQGFSAHFQADPYGRELLLQGLDEIGRTLLEEPSIAAYERSHA